MRDLLRAARASVDRVAGRLLVRVVGAVAVDATAQLAGRRLLVLAPHPDDETLAAGVTIQRVLGAGGAVTVVVATDGRHGDPAAVPPAEMAVVRRAEVARAVSVLGVAPADLVMLGFEDATLPADEDRLATTLRTVVEAAGPDMVVAPSPWDLHPDHAALGRATRRILAGSAVGHLEYLVWGWDQPSRLAVRAARRAWGRLGRWTLPVRPVLVDGSGLAATKAAALACHASQFSPGAVLHGREIGGTGPLGEEFVRWFASESEVFFPVRPGRPRRPGRPGPPGRIG